MSQEIIYRGAELSNNNAHSAWTLIPEQGFLPIPVATREPLPGEFGFLEELVETMPGLLEQRKFRSRVKELPVLPVDALSPAQLARVHALTAIAASGYIHEDTPTSVLPASIAVPLWISSQRLDMKPIMAYSDYVLLNWDLAPQSPFEIETIRPRWKFTQKHPNGGKLTSEEWFIAIHVVIEAQAAQLFPLFYRAQQAVVREDVHEANQSLTAAKVVLQSMRSSLQRMPEGNVPAAFFNDFRPFFADFITIQYEGIGTEVPYLKGTTAGQSTAIQLVDRFFDIPHSGEGKRYFDSMFDYVAPPHKQVIQQIATGPSIRAFALTHPELIPAYNEGIRVLAAFRGYHSGGLVKSYIKDQQNAEKPSSSIHPEGFDPDIVLPQLLGDTLNAALK